MKKKLIASILAALMVTSLVPASAFANTGDAQAPHQSKAGMRTFDETKMKTAVAAIKVMSPAEDIDKASVNADLAGSKKMQASIQAAVTAVEALGDEANIEALKNQLLPEDAKYQNAYDRYFAAMDAWYEAYGQKLTDDMMATVPDGYFKGGTTDDDFLALETTGVLTDKSGTDTGDGTYAGLDNIKYGSTDAAKVANTDILKSFDSDLKAKLTAAAEVAAIIADTDNEALLKGISEKDYYAETTPTPAAAAKAADVFALIEDAFGNNIKGADRYVGNISLYNAAKAKAEGFSKTANSIASDMAQAVSKGVNSIKTEADYEALAAKSREYDRLTGPFTAGTGAKADQGTEVTELLQAKVGDKFTTVTDATGKTKIDTDFAAVNTEIKDILKLARTNLDATAAAKEVIAAIKAVPALSALTLKDSVAVNTAQTLLGKVMNTPAVMKIVNAEFPNAVKDIGAAVEKIKTMEKTAYAEDYASTFMATYVAPLTKKLADEKLTTDDSEAFDIAVAEWTRLVALGNYFATKEDSTKVNISSTDTGKDIADALKESTDGTDGGDIANALYKKQSAEYTALESLKNDLKILETAAATPSNLTFDVANSDYENFKRLEEKYNALTKFQKTDDTYKPDGKTKTNLENYTDARDAYETVKAAFDKILQDKGQSGLREALITDLTGWNDKNITIEDKDTVYAFAERYNALTKDNQALVAATNGGQRLLNAIKTIDKLIAAPIIEKIEALPMLKATGETKDAIDAAAKVIGEVRAEYDKLTPSQKDQVANHYTKLLDAEKALNTAQQNYVNGLITGVLDSNIDPEKLTDEQAAQIKAANDAYGALTSGQKAGVASYQGKVKMENFNKLVSAMEAYMAKAYNLANATVTAEADVTYNGKAQKADSVKVVDALGNEVAADQYTVTYENNKDAGEATVVVTAAADGKYKGVNKTAKFTIKRADIAKVATIAPLVRTYTGKAIYQPESIVTVKGEALDRATEFGMVHKNNVSIKNNAQVTITGKGNYTGKIVKTFKIVPKNVKGNFTLKAGKKALTVKVNKLTGSVKYQYAYRVKGTTTWKYKYSSKNTITIGSLKAGKTYEVKARGYKGTTAAGTFVASTYGNVKTVKVK